MASIKFCPNCMKQVDLDVEVCECGYRFVEVVEKPAEAKKESFDYQYFDENDNSNKNANLNSDIVVKEPGWIATLALVLCLFGTIPGLVFAIIGKKMYKSEKYLGRCKAAIVLFVVVNIIAFILGFVFAEELAVFYGY